MLLSLSPVQEGKTQVAYELYTQAAQIDPLNDLYNAIIYCNRCGLLTRSGSTRD